MKVYAILDLVSGGYFRCGSISGTDFAYHKTYGWVNETLEEAAYTILRNSCFFGSDIVSSQLEPIEVEVDRSELFGIRPDSIYG